MMQSTRADEQPAQRALSPRLLWLAPFLASMLLFPPVKNILETFSANPDAISRAFWGMLVACAAASAALVAKSTRSASWSGPNAKWLPAACAAYTFSYVALIVIAQIEHASPWLAYALGAIQGLSIGFLIAEWIRLYTLDVRSIIINGSLSMAIAVTLSWLASYMPAAAALFAMATYVILSAAALVALARNATPTPEEEPSSPQPLRLGPAIASMFSVVWMPFAGALLGAWMMSSYTLSIDGFVVHSEFIGAVIAAVFAITFCAPQYKTSYSILIERIAIPILIGASVVFGSFPPGSMPFFLGAGSVYAPIIFLSIYALASLASMVRAGEFPLPFIFGTALFCFTLAEILGLITSYFVTEEDAIGRMEWSLVCILFATIIIHSGYTAYKQLTATTVETASEHESRGESPDVQIVEAAHQAKLESVISAGGLTKREAEVLGFLSRGYGSKYIAKTLFISDNTARTHIHNIYRKLGIGSREELLSLFNRE
ncbi:helix-turn-helix transcriptional regulator [uncultured Slackia sp.]|uniref:helix-turn-helix transcriptional regulator n=1 Tax=uncultured Slackia sp. TaxID=665903 RepID=UPI0026DCD150|nr:helix-turn-helix transcriptional regulator [uncultured Slackia sp.]